MKEWLATQSEWRVVEHLPAYGHDLNHIEKVWANLKTKELVDLCLDTISDHRSKDIATVIGEAFEKSSTLANGRAGDPISLKPWVRLFSNHEARKVIFANDLSRDRR